MHCWYKNVILMIAIARFSTVSSDLKGFDAAADEIVDQIRLLIRGFETNLE